MAGDLAAGPLLGEIMRRYPYAKATLPGIEGRWFANERKVWFEAAGLNRSQGDRALATLEERPGRGLETRDLLAPVYGWFTEGFETADLKEAKALLVELA